MNKKNNILLISDNEKLSESLASKIILLRNTDCVVTSNYKNALRNLSILIPDIVLLHENVSKEQTIDIISEFKNEKKNLSIILLVDRYDSEFILKAYDAGITDFCVSSADDFELVIRVINNIKTALIKNELSRNNKLLIQTGIIDELSGFYGYKFCREVFDNEINTQMLDEGVFMILSPSQESKDSFSYDRTCEAIKNSVRKDDIVSLGKGAKFYILLPKTNFEGAFVVLNKIKEYYGEGFPLKAGISNIYKKTFDELEQETLKALSEAMYSQNEYVMVESKEETLDSWLEEANEKNYKIFKQIFNKKMEKVIAPVFFRLQKTYEEKLLDTKIEQYPEEGIFHLKNKKQDSKLRIIYPGFAKIIIQITHEGFDSPENSEISLPLTHVTQKELIKIIEDFIKQFKLTSI